MKKSLILKFTPLIGVLIASVLLFGCTPKIEPFPQEPETKQEPEVPETFYTVTFIDSEGNEIESQKIGEGKAVSLKKGKEGYKPSFFDAEENQVDLFSYKVTKNVTLKVSFSPVSYKVQFIDTIAPDKTEEILCVFDESYMIPESITDEDSVERKSFVGWSTTQEVDESNPGNVFVPGAPFKNLANKEGATVTLYSYWTEVWVVSYELTSVLEDGTEITLDSEKFKSFKVPKNNPVIAGYDYSGDKEYFYKLQKPEDYDLYVFSEWKSKKANGNESKLFNNIIQKISSDITISAVWKEPVTVSVTSPYGQVPAEWNSKKVKYNSYIAPFDVPSWVIESYNPILLPEFEYEDYTLKGWKYRSASSEEEKSISYYVRVTEDTIFIPNWKSAVTVKIVTEDGENLEPFYQAIGADSNGDLTVPYGSNLVLESNTSSAKKQVKIPDVKVTSGNKVLSGWKYKIGESSESVINKYTTIPVTEENVTLIAQWEEGIWINIVSEYGNLDESEKQILVKKDTEVIDPDYVFGKYSYKEYLTLPELTDSVSGKNIGYWKYKKDGSGEEKKLELSDSIAITEPVTFTAIWGDPVLLTFNTDYGNLSEYSKTIPFGGIVCLDSCSQGIKEKSSYVLESFDDLENYYYDSWKYKGLSDSYEKKVSFYQEVFEDTVFNVNWLKFINIKVQSKYGSIPEELSSFKVKQGTYIKNENYDGSLSESVTLPNLSDEEHFVSFKGWNYEYSVYKRKLETYYFVSSYYEDVVFSAIWEKQPGAKCEIKFENPYGINPESIEVNFGDVIAMEDYSGSEEVTYRIPGIEIDSGKNTSWTYQVAGESVKKTLNSSSVLEVKDDILLTPNFSYVCKITLVSPYGDLPKSEYFISGNAYFVPADSDYTDSTYRVIKLPALEDTEDMHFSHWTYKYSNRTYTLSEKMVGGTDETITAVWVKKAPVSVSVSLPATSDYDLELSYNSASNYLSADFIGSNSETTYQWFIDGIELKEMTSDELFLKRIIPMLPEKGSHIIQVKLQKNGYVYSQCATLYIE